MGYRGFSRWERMGDLFLSGKQGPADATDCVHSNPVNLPHCNCRLPLPRQPLFDSSCKRRHLCVDRFSGRNPAAAIQPLKLIQDRSLREMFASTKMIIHPIEKQLVIDSPVDIYYRYIPLLEIAMGKNGIAKLFRNGRSQAVRLPQEFRFEGDRVRIRRIDEGVLLEPIIVDTRKWFAEMDRLSSEPFMKAGRKQPAAPRRKIFS